MPGIEIGPINVGVRIGPGNGPSFGSVIEGPVRGSLEGFRPMNISDVSTIDKGRVTRPLGEIVFNPQPLTAESAISQAEAIISEARTALNSVVPQPVINPPIEIPRTDLQGAVLPDLSTKPVTHLQPSPSTGSQTETVYAPAPQEQLVEEVVGKEETKTEDKRDESSEFREEVEVEELRLKYVEDEPVSRQRSYELREAIKKAKAEAQEQGAKEIEGWRIKKYFVPEHGGNRSGIAEPGSPDGSLVETYQVLSAENYQSEKEANEAAEATVTEKKPVKKAKEGKKVREIDIARIRRDTFLKRHPTEEVVARVVKKKILAEKLGQKPVVIHEVQAESSEGTIEDNLDLAEALLPQAA